MIAHADISVNAAYADMVNADGANSLNLKTCFCAKCAEVACIRPMAALRGEFNRSLQHIVRTSQPASDRARSFSAFH
jgi:hypothetical protein